MGECRKKDIAMMKAKGKNKGFGKGKKPPQQVLYGTCKEGSLEIARFCLDWK